MHNAAQTKWLKDNGWAFNGTFYRQHGHLINQRNAQTGKIEVVPAYLVIYSEQRDDVFVCEMIAENGANGSPRFIKGSLKNCFALARDHYGKSRAARLSTRETAR